MSLLSVEAALERLLQQAEAAPIEGVEQVALALGYAEAAAFIHAFQRWAGCTPAAWRRQQATAE